MLGLTRLIARYRVSTKPALSLVEAKFFRLCRSERSEESIQSKRCSVIPVRAFRAEKPLTYVSTNAFVGLVLTSLLLSSCNLFDRGAAQSGGTNPVARVYDQYLYEADLKGVGANAATPEDSVQAVKNYIDSWIRQELVLRYAKENLPEEMTEIDKQIERYRRSLITYTYERELVAQKLDTVVSEADVQAYYDRYKDAFALRTGLFNARYVRLRNAPADRLDSVRAWMKTPSYANNSRLQNFCEQYGVRCATADTAWFTQEELGQYLPLEKLNWETIGFRKGFAETTDNADLCMVKVTDYKFKGSYAPLAYVRNDIYNVIINKRKLDYIKRVHDAIYDDALKSKRFETYQ